PLRLKRGGESIELSPWSERRISCTIVAGGQPEPWRGDNGVVLDVPTRVITLAGQREPILRHDPETSTSMELPDSADANATEEVTVACRLRSEGPTGTWQSMATKWSADDRNWGLILGRDTGELTFSATFTKGVRGYQDISSKYALFDGQWHHVAATYSAHDAQVCFYVDGKLVQTVHRDGGPMPAIKTPARVASGFIDGRQKPAKTMAVMKGLRVWNRALSADEIAAQTR
ncbi:MAG TPA: LamG domain-containing protein, partial [Verrucomicrobiae bacterium]|nr:LamG domain-containing protein [Verrucomicrobiae bacterium]